MVVADGMSDDGTREILQRMADGSQKPEVRSQRSEVCRQSSDLRSPISDLPAASQPPRLRLIDNPGRIVPTGLNAAIRAARGDIIIRMDAHTEYGPDYVRQCVAVLQETAADNVGGPARTKAETYMQKAVAAAYHSPFAVGGARFHNVDYEGPVDTVTYGCWRKEAFERFGYFDEELVRNQDDEHNLRIIRGGGQIWQSPRIKSWYRPRGTLGALFCQYMQYGYWKVRVIQKHKLPASWRHLVPGAFVLILMLLALGSLLLPLASWLFSLGSSGPAVRGPVVPWSRASLVALLLALSSYLIAVSMTSVHTAWKSEWRLLPALPLVFPCYHFGYGWGFLRGLWDFVVRRRKQNVTFEKLTR